VLNPGALNPGALNPGALNPGALNPGALNPGALERRELLRVAAVAAPLLVMWTVDRGLMWMSLELPGPLRLLLGFLGVCGALWAMRRAGQKLHTLEASSRHQQLVRLADRYEGRLLPVDLVRELGVTFQDATGLLDELAREGYATLEFDARTGGMAYRLG